MCADLNFRSSGSTGLTFMISGVYGCKPLPLHHFPSPAPVHHSPGASTLRPSRTERWSVYGAHIMTALRLCKGLCATRHHNDLALACQVQQAFAHSISGTSFWKSPRKLLASCKGHIWRFKSSNATKRPEQIPVMATIAGRS